MINGAEYYFDRNGTMQTGEFVVNGKLFTTNENGVVLSKTTMKNGWTNCRVAGIIIKMELHILVLLVPTMLLMVRWLATVLWSGRAKDITSEKMENILSIPGAMMDIAMQPKMVLLYVVNGKRLTESSTISNWEGVLYPYFYYGKGVYTKEGAYLSPDGYAQLAAD